ncbi:hypothetical protein Sango_2313200 [Sesamum angolense]|uniref:Uncharacterized protein n=1 Tax=Sesamum angolense TaxID=2727404 RepID=A0AAE2BLH0_9LAMI|nr:hypothetical protein Sango_2313200 [Sesamum angolense]
MVIHSILHEGFGLEKVQDGTLQTRIPSARHGVELSKKQSPETDEELKRMLDVPYALVVGNIQCIAQCTRPEVSYALSVTSRYQVYAEEAHWTIVKTLRFVFKLNGGVVAWKSSKQDTRADSTTEAKYIVASKASKEAVWMKNNIQELGVVPSFAEPVVVFYMTMGL